MMTALCVHAMQLLRQGSDDIVYYENICDQAAFNLLQAEAVKARLQEVEELQADRERTR
jgi:hypothetical protein